MNENSKPKDTEQLTREEKSKAAEIARMMARLPEREQEKIYYMLKGSEIINGKILTQTPIAAV